MATCCFAMCVPLQTRWRSFRVRRQLDHRQSAVAFIHALWRGCSQRRRYRRHIQDITLLQALCRGYLQRRRYKEMVSEKRRQEALEREEEHKWRHDNSDGMQKAEEEEKGGRRQNEVGQGEAEVMPEENPGESLESKEKLTEYKEMVSEKSRQEALEREEEHKWRHDNSDGVQKAEEEEKGGRRQNEVGQGEAEVMPEKENPGESLESMEKLTEYKEMVSENSRQEALEREEEHKWRHDNSDGVQKAEEEEKGGRRYKEMVSEKSRQEALEREEEHKWRHDNSDGVQKAEEEEKGGRRQNEVGQGEAEVMPEKENPGESLESKEKLTEYKEMVSENSRQEALEREEEHKWRHDNSDGVQKAEEEEKGGRRYKEMVSEKSRQEALEREEEHKWRHDNSDGVQKAEEEEKGGRRQNEVGQGEAEVMPEKENPGESLESKEKLTEYKEMVSENSRQEALEREEEHKWRHDNSDGVQKAEEEEKGGRRQNEVGQGEAAVMPEEENPGESLESKEKLTEVQKAEEEEKGGRRQNEVGQGEAEVMPEKENPGESLESKEKLTENKLQRNPSKISEASTIQSPCDLAGGRKNLGNHHFGVHVGDLISETSSVPVVMEMLLEYLEMYGLHTEGIYRKCGAANRMRELKQSLENDPSSVKLDNYPIHVITGILKQWLRELPEPLMTFAQYNEFLRAVELPGRQEQLCAIYKVLGQLPQAHYNTLERLIFHLVK
ncbi:uncharacterized protein LOC142476218 [Ascaphus truei]|uniref:uncharacterized protein LOC142476218 n=1 Tax=Ascaphus truei TaxID=8439 RepID=UPI003F5A70F7